MRRLKRVEICCLVLAFSVPLCAQESRVDIRLFGLASFPLQGISKYTTQLNAFGDSWDSYQDIVFDKNPLRFGWGAGLTYWISHNFGLQMEARSWTKHQPSEDNSVHIEYSYYPWYPHPSDQAVEVSSDLKSPVPPELSYRIGSFCLNGIWRGKIGAIFLEAFGGPVVYHLGGELADLYLYRTIPSSHGTFLSDEVRFTSRFDFLSIGGNLGVGFSVPLGGTFEAFLRFTYFFGGSKDPEMFVESMDALDGPVMSIVIPGIDDLKEHIRYRPTKINPSSLSLSLGLRYMPSVTLDLWENSGRFRLMLELGGSMLNPDLDFERTLDVMADRSRVLTQEIEIFNKKAIYSYGLGVGYSLSPRWALELGYRHRQKAAAVDSGPIFLTENEVWKNIVHYQRPEAELKMDEWTLSLVSSLPIPGAEILALAGANIARLSLPMSSLYFRYMHEPWTDDFVSLSGLYSTTGSAWTWGARLGLGLQFRIVGPLESRIMATYNLYRDAQVPMAADDTELDDETWGYGDLSQMNPEWLKISPIKLPVNPSGFQLAFALAFAF
jgi:hypothetical protein